LPGGNGCTTAHLQRRGNMEIDWSPYLIRAEKLLRQVTLELNKNDYVYAFLLLSAIEDELSLCQRWIKENIDDT
jgi:hypothetical protein